MATELRAGSLLGGRYRLERVLGAGGMAAVWLARDERLERPAAVKILSDTLAADSTYLSRFRREARLAAGLSHPNLVTVYDFGGEGDRPFLAMEHVEGGTLADRISDGSARELDASRLARELLGALDYIHRADIIHRDVKPANVLFAPDGTAKLTDFGIAQPEDATRLTSTGLVIGTHSYLAPEVARGERATVRSDLYSCGVVLREAFGDPPPAGLADLIARLGADDPARRPASASRALGLLATPRPPAAAGPAATAATERLATERSAEEIPVGAAARSAGREKRTRVAPRTLAAVSALTALVVVGVVLLTAGDEGSSPATAPAGDPALEDVTPQPAAEGGGEGQGTAAPSEGSSSGERGAEKKPKRSKGSGKDKKRGPSKEPPGKAKGHSKN